MLISLKKFGADQSVNPKYVTSVETANGRTRIWVVGSSGYVTYSTYLSGSVEEVTKFLNEGSTDCRLRPVLAESLHAVIRSVEDAVSDDPKRDWKASLADAADCLRSALQSLKGGN